MWPKMLSFERSMIEAELTMDDIADGCSPLYVYSLNTHFKIMPNEIALSNHFSGLLSEHGFNDERQKSSKTGYNDIMNVKLSLLVK